MSTVPADSGEPRPAEGAEDKPPSEIAHAVLRGTIGAMAMTGLRSFTVSVGLVEEPPPRAILRQKSKGLFKILPKRFRRAGQEVFHWGFGAAGGAVFGMFPRSVRMKPWSGPAWGLGIWLVFELVAAPALGLSQAKKVRPIDRVTLAADHLLYGLVLSEFHPRPRE